MESRLKEERDQQETKLIGSEKEKLNKIREDMENEKNRIIIELE